MASRLARVLLSVLLPLLLVSVAGVSPAAAQWTNLGATIAASGHVSVIQGLAYSPRHDVYLSVYEAPDGVRGRFVRANGATVGNVFSIAQLGQQGIVYANKPMVAYSHDTADDVFFVMYASDHAKSPDAPPSAWIQRVRFDGNGGVREGGPIQVGTLAWEVPNDLVYNPATRQFVAVWERFFSEGPDVMARFFNADGTAGSAIINVSNANWSQGAAKAAVDWERNRILIAYQGLHPNSPPNPEILGMWAKVVDGANGNVMTSLLTVFDGFTIEAVPVFLPERDGFVIGWTGFNPGRDVLGRFVSSADGSVGLMPQAAFVIAGSGRQEGAAMGMYDAISRKVLVAVQSSGGCPGDTCPYLDGATLDGMGTPLGTATGLSTAVPSATGGTFYPDVAVGEGGQFGVGYSLNYSSIWVERVSLPAAQTPGPIFGGGGVNPEPTTGAIAASPTSLRFAATKSGATLTSATPPHVVTVSFVDSPGGPWTATSSVPWLAITNGSGSGAGQFTVAVINPSDVIGGQTSLSGSVIITSPGAPNSPRSLSVSLSILPIATTMAPFGSFDSPIQGSTVAGTVPVTGWALDDIGVDRVEIWRDVVPNDVAPPFNLPGHPGHGKIYVGNGLIVEGTRPDVQALYGSYPLNHRAGWGYMLLTWAFPNANGPFTLHAIAWDKEGRFASLGSRNIVVNNAAATKPFGTIDVPGYGGTFTGSQYAFGWVLTPAPGCSMTGGNITMTVDSAPPSIPVTYGGYRADVAAAFPGFVNANGAGGHAVLNSTLFTNGLHTIGWLAYDNCNNGDGIGSRFFTILNGAPQPVSTDVVTRQGPAFGQVGTEAEPAAPSAQPLWLVRGIGTPATLLGRDAAVWLSQTGRIEVHATMPDGWDDPRETFEAYLEVAGALQALPVGSSFDTQRGVFHWQPVAGFFGKYPVRIVRLWDGQPVDSKTVVVVVSPEAGDVVLNIDSPTQGAQVGSGFTVSGWALRPQATEGSGVGAVHVWATRRDASAAAGSVFLGSAELSGNRRDVGDHFGRQFDGAGFSLSTAALPAGTWDIVVYASDARTGEWATAKQVTVTVK